MRADEPERSRRPSIRLRWGRVSSVGVVRPGAAEIVVEVEGTERPALSYPELVGDVSVGDHVLLNTTALELGLGTGGVDLVIAVEGARTTEETHAGSVMKARYMPHQVAVAAVEETHRDVLESADGLGGAPVVCVPLHSMVGVVAAGAKAAGAGRIVYVMTDGAALPGALSRLVPRLLEAGVLDTWITCGHAFGGELEAVTVWSALIAAVEVARAEVVVVADGPGNLGTETTWGVSALGSGHALNAAGDLGGRPVAGLRVSFADPRERHRSVSHHSLTVLERVASPGVHVAVPTLDGPEREAVWGSLRARAIEERHQLVEVDGRPGPDELERRALGVETMGRGQADDPAFFLAAGAAGVLAARMAVRGRAWKGDRR